MLVAEGTLTHVCQLDRALGTSVHEPVAAHRVEFGGCDNLGELFHIRGLDIHDVETLVLDVKVPEVYAEIVTADKCLAIAVDRYAVDVVGVGVGISLPRYGGHYCVMVGQARQLEVGRILDDTWQSPRTATAGAGDVPGRGLVGQVVLGHHLEGLLENLPQLDRLVIRREEVVGSILSPTPLDLVDLLFDFEGLEVIELGFVRLEFGVEFVLAGFFLLDMSGTSRSSTVIAVAAEPTTHCFVALEQDNSSTLITGCQVVSCMVELNGRYDVRWPQVSVVILGGEEGYIPRGVSIPSVISSTSPLSPKHLAGKLRQQRGYHKIRRSSGGGGGQQPGPGLSTWQRAAGRAEQRRGSEHTG